MSATQPPSEARRVSVGDISLQVRIDGGDGPWVILAHALGANHTLWDATARHLAPRYRVLRYDLRGHGQSDAPIGAYSMIRSDRRRGRPDGCAGGAGGAFRWRSRWAA
ncbi:alpha/beta fold hydrolase [Cupriavidus basilensis]